MAYTFLTDADVLGRLRDQHINSITDNTPTIRYGIESQAISVVKSALYGRYNTSALFVVWADPDPRHPLLVLHVLNVFTYLLYRRINPAKIPDSVKEDYDDTQKWLARVTKGQESPDFPAIELPDTSTNDFFVGGGVVRKGHYF